MTGEVFDIKRFAVQDGPGLRATAFLKGCPLGCVWCHNPEGKRPGLEIGTLPLQCIGCGACLKVCQSGAIRLEGSGIAIARERCTRCGLCASACPAGAILARGRELTAAALVEELAKEEVFFKSSGGGVTLSGGEPLAQPAFMTEVLGLAKERGYHTAVESCLHAPAHLFEGLIKLPDLWIADLKLWDAGAHQKLTGLSNQLILQNYARLAESGQAVLTRIPIIPGCTDAEENLLSLGRYIARVNPHSKVELIFYNPLAGAKYKNYDLDYPLFGAGPYAQEEQRSFRGLVAATGVCVI